jgi:enterochelin esterase-like enzyme/outer membrane protein assembly factor BamB
MRVAWRGTAVLAVCFCLALSVAGATTGDWPQMRGPAGDGRVTGTELFSGDRAGLSLTWRIPLGLGYSGIAVADGRAVTLFSDGTHDVAMAVNTLDGKELWRYSIAETYLPHDGSEGGPLSTPVIHDGMVYVLGPKGQLVALKLASGEMIWSKMLPSDFGAVEPEFGFTTSPVVADGVLIVQTGGSEGRALSGLDTRSGKTLWSLGDEKVEYQSPAVVTLAGQRQVVAISGHQISGIEAKNGKVLWEHVLDEKDNVYSSNVMPLDDDGFMTFVGRAAVRFKVSKDDSGYSIQELYRSEDLGGTYALPVEHKGYIYGFKRQFLTCIDAGTGELVWKSRPPGGRGLILVDGHLIVYAAQGNVVVVKATPEGYMETARVQAMEGSGYTWPSFAGNQIFVRSLGEMAAVKIVTAPTGALAAAGGDDAAAMNTAFMAFVHKLEKAENKQELIDQFLAEHDTLPVVEGEFVHFVYNGAVEDLAIEGNMIEGGAPETMSRVAGTDFYYRSYRLIPRTRWEYRYVVDFDNQVADPRNSETVPADSDEVGWSTFSLDMPATAMFFDEPPEGQPRGTIETITYKKEAEEGEGREIRVYLPSGYAENEKPYPLLVVHGLDWLDKGLLANTLDNLIGTSVQPVVVAVMAPRPEWWLEGGGTGTSEYVDILATEIVPFIEGKYRIKDEAASRAVMGGSFFGVTSVLAALKHPDVFGSAAAQSANMGLGADEEMMALMAERKGEDIRFYVGWNRYEFRDLDSGEDVRDENLRLAQALEENGFTFQGGEVLDAFGWGSWRARSDDILVALFPMP